MRQGQGRTTERKQNGFTLLFQQRLRVSKAGAAAGHPYWHVDLNAGCGRNEIAGCLGSPLVFLNEAVSSRRRFNALMCDSDPDAIRRLDDVTYFARERADGSQLRLVCDDNAAALAQFSEWIADEEKRPELAVGTWLCDPNGGSKENRLPLEALKRFCHRHQRIDAVLSLNISLFARVRKCKGNPRTPGFDHWPDPQDVCGLRPFKAHWLVRNPAPRRGSGESFTMFLGSNHPGGMEQFEQFYRLESAKGQEIVNNLKRVQPDQPWLWEDWKESEA